MEEIQSAAFGDALKTYRKRYKFTQRQLAERMDVHYNTILNWERGDYLPATKGIVLELARQLGLEDDETRHLLEASLTVPTFYWNVPYRRNPCFTGREAFLQNIHTLLAAQQPVALTQAAALSGLGGIGKTQVAIEYAYRYRLGYRAVFWLAAETAESLMTSVQQIADLLHFPTRENADQSQLGEALRRWLTTHQEWLVIADNVEELDLLYPLLPSLGAGALLLTTRRQALGKQAELLVLPPMSQQEGIRLLLRRSGQDLGSAFGKSLPQESLKEAPIAAEAAQLVELLEGLPLALDQAGAYLEETGCQISDYVQRYLHQRKQILAYRGIHAGAHPASVATTLRLSVEQVERVYPAAGDLLRLCAFLHAEAMPEEIFGAGASHLGPVLHSLVTNPYQFDLALAALRGASLITRHAETRALTIHRLVQAVLRDQMEPAETQLWSKRVILMLNAAFPTVAFNTWAQCERYIAHVLACLPLLEQAGSALPEASEVLFRAGSYLLARGRLASAETLLNSAVVLKEQALDVDGHGLLELLGQQGELYWMQGKYELAEQLLWRVLALEERELGASHPLIAETLSNLRALYRSQGKPEQAEPLYMRAVQNHNQASELSTPQTMAETLNTLGVVCYAQGKYEQAEALYQHALRVREEHLGSTHPDTAGSLNALGLLYWSQGKYTQAEPILKRALAIRETQLGSEHPDIGASLNNLAALYRSQGKYEQAEPLYQRALLVHEEQLGTEHPDTAASLNNLANLYNDQGKHVQAEALHRRALAIREAQLGPEHPDTALSLNNLANLYRDQGKHAQAEQLFVRALLIREQKLGPEHPDTATTLHNLALLRQAQEKYLEARSLFERALQIRTKVRGSGHSQTRKTSASLDDLLRLMGEKIRAQGQRFDEVN